MINHQSLETRFGGDALNANAHILGGGTASEVMASESSPQSLKDGGGLKAWEYDSNDKLKLTNQTPLIVRVHQIDTPGTSITIE